MSGYNPPDRIETGRLLLRLPVPDDATAIFEEYASDPDVTRYLRWPPHRTIDTLHEVLGDFIRGHHAGTEYGWVLTLEAEDRPIGMLTVRPGGHQVELGYVLGKRHWGQGYMTEAVDAVAGLMLARPDIYRVCAHCDTENPGSARVLEKAGFEREGLLRRWSIHPNVSAEPRDCYAYSRVR